MPSSTLTRQKNPQIRKLTAKELQDRRERGLCFNCDEKFIPGHRCAKLFWLELRKGSLGCCKLVLLIDSGSTHNFISSAVARKVGITLTAAGKMEVLVANSEILASGGICRGVMICLGGFPFMVDFYVLEIEGCEAVLGVVWLNAGTNFMGLLKLMCNAPKI
jgi:hypothetical protein